jgi:hypothetical protein
MSPQHGIQTKKGVSMKRLHVHVAVESLPDAVEFYSDLFDKPHAVADRHMPIGGLMSRP